MPTRAPAFVMLLGTLMALSAPSAGAQEATRSPALRAAVFERSERITAATGVRVLLERAGAEVIELPLERSPDELAVDLVVIGSLVADRADYQRYMERFASGLRRFVERGGVLLQLTQPVRAEVSPAFLPESLSVRRGELGFDHLSVLEQGSPLLEALAYPWFNGPYFPLRGHPLGITTLYAFEEQQGFSVLLWCDTQIPYSYPALLEARYGEGRLLLSSLLIDKVFDDQGRRRTDEVYEVAAEIFFTNLARYTILHRRGTLPPPVTPEPEPEPLPFVEGSTTLVLLPDTQICSAEHPRIFAAQTRWIADNRDSLRISFVLHAGDLVNEDDMAQWRVAKSSMRVLDGVVPYAVVPGNHDYHGRSLLERQSYLSQRFPVKEVRQRPSFGGVFEEERIDNSYHLFTAAGRDWIVVALEYYPRDEVVAWAGGLLEQHAERTAIVLTHAYLGQDSLRIDLRGRRDPPQYRFPDDLNDGEDLWQDLVSPHANVALVLCGHVTGTGTGYLMSTGEHGQVVHQVLANYQMRPNGGDGYLRLLEILPDGVTLQMKTYSPWLDRHLAWPQHQRVLTLPPLPDP